MECTSLLMAILARPQTRKEVWVTPVATEVSVLEGAQMKNPRKKTPPLRCGSILSISQGSTLHLHDRVPIEENATKAEVVEAEEIGNAIGGHVHLEVETAGVVEAELLKDIKITRLF